MSLTNTPSHNSDEKAEIEHFDEAGIKLQAADHYDDGSKLEAADAIIPGSKGLPEKIKQLNAALYVEALEKYGQDGDIDPEVEKKLKRKIDRRIIPLLGICYFFYVSSSLEC